MPVVGDIPIFIHVENTRRSLSILEMLSDVQTFYPAWDQVYSLEQMRRKIAEAGKLVEELDRIVRDLDSKVELSVLVDAVCERLHAPMWKTNPLFARTVDCCRRRP